MARGLCGWLGVITRATTSPPSLLPSFLLCAMASGAGNARLPRCGLECDMSVIEWQIIVGLGRVCFEVVRRFFFPFLSFFPAAPCCMMRLLSEKFGIFNGGGGGVIGGEETRGVWRGLLAIQGLGCIAFRFFFFSEPHYSPSIKAYRCARRNNSIYRSGS